MNYTKITEIFTVKISIHTLILSTGLDSSKITKLWIVKIGLNHKLLAAEAWNYTEPKRCFVFVNNMVPGFQAEVDLDYSYS